jgi:threonine/homoserine/homoserine lactone efflux protein
MSALLVASEPAFLTVKYLGVAYLLYLGLHAIWSAARRRPASAPPEQAGEPGRHSAPACYRRGLLSDLGNPKMAVFFTSLLPQFGAGFAGLTLLGLVFCAMTFVWLACYAVAVATMSGLLRRSPVRRVLDAVTGTVLVGLGVRLATEQP